MSSMEHEHSFHTITLLIADDHNVVRQGLRMLLACEPQFHLLGEAASGRDAVELACQLCPNVVLMDLAMSQLNGFEATRQIRSKCPRTRILALSSYDRPEMVRHALAAGAAGYVLKHAPFPELLQAIRDVHEGHAYFSPQIAHELRSNLVRAEAEADPPAELQLSSREAEVLQLVAEGLTSKAIAYELGISIKTAEKHRQNLMRRLDLHSVPDLVRYAARHGLIESRPHQEVLAGR